MNRLAFFALLALVPLGLSGCSRQAPDPTDQSADRQEPDVQEHDVPDAELQLIEEEEHRTREAEANTDEAPPAADTPAAGDQPVLVQ